MKKLAVMLLTISMLAASSSAFAATEIDNTTGTTPRNNVETVMVSDKDGSLPGFRPTDKIIFKVKNAKNGGQLTLISYKVDAENSLSNANIQYINQYTVGDSGNVEVLYTVRDIDPGKYLIKINGGNDNETNLLTFYYKVANPKFKMIEKPKADEPATQAEGETAKNGEGITGNFYNKTQYSEDTYSVGFVGKVTTDSNDVNLQDIGVNSVGFKFSDTNTQSHNINWNRKTEAEGSVTLYYGLDINEIPSTEKVELNAEAVEGTVKTTTSEEGAE